MEDNPGNEPLVFKELPKEQQKALHKEYAKTDEAKKMKRLFITLAVIFAAVVIAIAVISIVTKNGSFSVAYPTFLVCIWPAVIQQQKFEKWLAAEKNIIVRKKKPKK